MSIEVVNAGSLNSNVELILHTNYSVVMFFGRKNDSNDKYITGLTGFLTKIGLVARGCANNDPYADWVMLKVEERMKKVQGQLKKLQEEVDTIKAGIPEEVLLGKNLSEHPVRLPFFASTPLAFQAAYLLIDFDRYVRDVLLLRHIGLIGTTQKSQMSYRAAHQLRSLYCSLQNYRPAWVSREDMLVNNDKAQQAIAKFGIPPEDVLRGVRRSQFAPAVRKKFHGLFLHQKAAHKAAKMNGSFDWLVPPEISKSILGAD